MVRQKYEVRETANNLFAVFEVSEDRYQQPVIFGLSEQKAKEVANLCERVFWMAPTHARVRSERLLD